MKVRWTFLLLSCAAVFIFTAAAGLARPAYIDWENGFAIAGGEAPVEGGTAEELQAARSVAVAWSC